MTDISHSSVRSDEEILKEILEELDKKLKHFDDGRIDYTHADYVPVLNIFVMYEGKILLLKRSDKVHSYKGKWNSIGSFIDKQIPRYELVLQEMEEELGLTKNDIKEISFGRAYRHTDDQIGTTWYIHPVIVELLNEPTIELDWEHTEYKWIDPSELAKYDVLPNLEETYEHALER